jgi:hypothetical protein
MAQGTALRLIYSAHATQHWKKKTRYYEEKPPQSPNNSGLSQRWASKLDELRAVNPALAQSVEELTDDFLALVRRV